MAYSDLGVLLPTESQYGNPQAYSEEIRAEAAQRAQYLSQMDQYYTSLEESKRQFDLQYAAREKEFEWTSKFQEEQLAEQARIEAERLAENKRQFDVAQEAATQSFTWESGFQEKKLSYEQAYSDKELALGQLSLEKSKYQTEADIAMKQLGLSEYATKSQVGAQNFQNQLALLNTQLGMQQAFPNGVQISQGGVGQYPQYQSATDYYKNQLSALSKAAQAGGTTANTGTYTPTASQSMYYKLLG